MKKDNLTHNDIEFYLLNREYNELQGDEKQFVDSQISSEQEFNELKAIMQGVNVMFDQEEELTPSPQIKANLLKEFEKNRPAGGFWLNGTIVTLFPREKSFFRKPGVQLLAMAASVALLIGIFFINDNGIQNNSLALHQEKEKSKIEKHNLSEKEEVAKDSKVIDKLEDVEDEETINQVIADISILEEKELERSEDNPPAPAETSYFANGEAKDIDFDANNSTATGGVTTVNTSTDYRLSSVTEEVSAEEDDKLVISGDLDATVFELEENEAIDIADNEQYLDDEVSRGATISTNSATDNLAKKEVSQAKVKSRSLAEDDELIDLLYTAL